MTTRDTPEAALAAALFACDDPMPIRDTPEAALAAALFAYKRPSSWPTWDEYQSAMGQAVRELWLQEARNLLAVMPDWTLVPKDGWKMVPEEDGDPYNPEAEIARLRAALEAIETGRAAGKKRRPSGAEWPGVVSGGSSAASVSWCPTCQRYHPDGACIGPKVTP
jgi:hypothetical protein